MSEAASHSDTVARIDFTDAGNSGPCKRFGWSHEEPELTWTVGRSAELVLPLPPDATHLRVEIGITPFVHPPRLMRQRLSIEVNGRALPELVLHQHDVLSFEVDRSQLAAQDELILVFTQPSATSPRSMGLSADARVLGFAFHWLRLRRLTQPAAAPFEPRLLSAGNVSEQQARIIVHGDHQARQVQEIAGRLPCLEQTFTFRWLSDASKTAEAISKADDLAAVWCQIDPTRPDPPLLRLIPEGVTVITFPRLTMPILWPFEGHDPRQVPEPAYPNGRYVFGDIVGASLADEPGTDDEVFAEYLRRSAARCPDLGHALEDYAAALAEADARCTVQVADFILGLFIDTKLFHNSHDPTGLLLRQVAQQAIIASELYRTHGLATVLRELNELTQGYRGLFEDQIPINPIVARRFGLRWHDPAAHYRYGYNKWTFRDYILQYIRWRPWCL